MTQEREGSFCYRGSWRETYLTSTGLAAADQQRFTSLRVENFFSDLLYQPWFCATVPLSPEWLERDTLERHSNLSAEEFRRLFEVPNKPVVITDQVSVALVRWRLRMHPSHLSLAGNMLSIWGDMCCLLSSNAPLMCSMDSQKRTGMFLLNIQAAGKGSGCACLAVM